MAEATREENDASRYKVDLRFGDEVLEGLTEDLLVDQEMEIAVKEEEIDMNDNNTEKSLTGKKSFLFLGHISPYVWLITFQLMLQIFRVSLKINTLEG